MVLRKSVKRQLSGDVEQDELKRGYGILETKRPQVAAATMAGIVALECSGGTQVTVN